MMRFPNLGALVVIRATNFLISRTTLGHRGRRGHPRACHCHRRGVLQNVKAKKHQRLFESLPLHQMLSNASFSMVVKVGIYLR